VILVRIFHNCVQFYWWKNIRILLIEEFNIRCSRIASSLFSPPDLRSRKAISNVLAQSWNGRLILLSRTAVTSAVWRAMQLDFFRWDIFPWTWHYLLNWTRVIRRGAENFNRQQARMRDLLRLSTGQTHTVSKSHTEIRGHAPGQ